MNQLFVSGGQSTGASGSASVLPMNIQGWFPLGLTGLIFLQSKGLSRVLSSTTVQKHQFFWCSKAFSLLYGWSNSHIHTWLHSNHSFDCTDLCQQRDPTSPSWRKSVLNIHWKDWCRSGNSNTWPPDAKNWVVGKDPDAGKDWSWEEKGRQRMRMLDGITD